MRIDTTKIGKGEVFSADVPLKCHVDKMIDGVQFVGKHDGEVTDLSMCQWMTTRLVSASVDGTVCIFPVFLYMVPLWQLNSFISLYSILLAVVQSPFEIPISVLNELNGEMWILALAVK